ncbi:MAG: histidine phosphatase family protein [Parachlamydia sp.]|nr:histidine phosphatase family protein [Parachlamydia sp.]
MRQYNYWTLAINPAQPTLGTLAVIAKRPVERLCELLPDELQEWQQIARSSEKALLEVFHPDRLNYLQTNREGRIAMLIVPRYEKERIFAGKSWHDEAYGSFPAWKENEETTEVMQALFEVIAKRLAPVADKESMTLYFLRHGETEWSQKGILEGSKDLPLNDAGKKQTQQLKERMGSFPFDLCAISNSLRAEETASILAGKLPLIQDARLRERGWGNWEGRFASDLKRAHPAELGGVESAESVAVRLSDFMNEMALMHPSGTRMLAITHSGVMRVLIAMLLGFGNLDAEIGITYYSFVKVKLTEGRWRVERMDNVLLPTIIAFA